MEQTRYSEYTGQGSNDDLGPRSVLLSKPTGRNNHRALIAPGCQIPRVQQCSTTRPTELATSRQPLRRSSARNCATTPPSYGSLPTPCPTGWASTIVFNCRVGCALLPTTRSPREPSHPLSQQVLDVTRLRRGCTHASSAVVIGAKSISCEAASSLALQGVTFAASWTEAEWAVKLSPGRLRRRMFRSAQGGEQQSSGDKCVRVDNAHGQRGRHSSRGSVTERVACGPRKVAAHRVYAGYGGSPKLNVETT